jgi:cyclophilin family peptidyl-prolyl cis-trans isomerase
LHGLTDIQVAQKFALGNGGSGKTVPLEPKLAHERGTVALARSADIDSGDSQFFFNLKANHLLDSQYCVFGRVTKGLDVMDKIELGDRITSLRVTSGK